MDFVSAQQTDVRFKSQCNKHDNQPVNFYCKKCMLPICRDCTMLDHRERDGHTITDLKTELEDSAERFTDIGRRYDGMVTTIFLIYFTAHQLNFFYCLLNGNINKTFSKADND